MSRPAGRMIGPAMTRLAVLAVAGFAIGFVLTLDTVSVDACNCAGFWERSDLQLVEVSPDGPARRIFGGPPGVDDAASQDLGYLTCCDRSDGREWYTLTFRGMHLEMERR